MQFVRENLILKNEQQPKALILNIGNEILIGQIRNSNSEWLSQNLFKIGFDVVKIVSIGDKYSDIYNELSHSAKIYDLVVITGGLGPTNDDKTKTILSDFFKMPLVLSEDVLSDIKNRVFKRTGTTELNKRNKSQALVPYGCHVFRNCWGTAPAMGFVSSEFKAITIALPGVPVEMKNLFENSISQFLHQHFALTPQEYDIFYVSGIPESTLAHVLEEWENRLPPENQLAYLPASGIIRLRLHKSNTPKDKYTTIVEDLYKLIGNNIIAKNSETFTDGLGQLLVNRNLTICTAESCTGGNIARVITLQAGASRYFKGSVVAYSNSAKINLLNVSSELINQHGSVSQEVAEAMATGAQKIFETDISIATTGIAGPDGGTNTKPVGTVWITVNIKGSCFSEKFIFDTVRKANIERATNAAIFAIYDKITGKF